MMMQCAVSHEVTYTDWESGSWSSQTSQVSTALSQVFDTKPHNLTKAARRGRGAQEVSSSLVLDMSSVLPRVGSRVETASIRVPCEPAASEAVPELEHNVVVRMAPKSVTPMRIQVKYVRKAEPLVVEPTDT